MSFPKAEIELALIDVRKAYRLLHDYQRAAMDAAKYIGAQLGFSYAGGWPRFSDCSPREGKGSLDNWAWDWLNLVFYEFYFEKEIGGNEFLCLSILSFGDTGYFISDSPAADRTDVATFAEAENSGTKVGFLLYRTWNEEFNRFYDDKNVRRFLGNHGTVPEDLKETEILGKCCDFSRLADELSTEEVINELVRHAQSNGFPLERIKKAI